MNESESVISNQFSVSRFNEHYLSSVNRGSFENIDSKTLFKQRFKDDIFKKDSLHVIIGLDSGLLANYILSHKIPCGSKYIFVEIDAVLALLNVDIPQDVQKFVQVLSPSEFIQYLDTGDDDLYLVKDLCLTHNSIGSTMGIIEQYSEASNLVKNSLMLRTWEKKSYFQQKIFLAQQLKNLTENQSPASVLNNRFTGKTCIIVGGGPSLDEHIDWISEHYEDLFIITVSRMAARLSSAKIPAHIIVSVDPQDVSFEVNRDMMSLVHESLFINSHHVNHRILSQWQGKSLYLGSRLPWLKNDADNIPTIGPTVTNSAVRIAIRLGFKTILLTGADFCFSSNGISHAKGALEANAGANNSLIGEWVETYAGNIAETPIQLTYAASALADEAKEHPEVDIFNLSINAAKIDGIKYLSTSNISLISANISPKQLLDMIPNSSLTKAEYLDNIHTELIEALAIFTSIEQLAKQAIELNSQARKYNIQSKQYRSIVKQTNIIEAKLSNDYNAYSQVIKFYGFFEFSKFLTIKESKKWSIEHMQNMTHQYYKAFQLIAHALINYINTSVTFIDMRKEELVSQPDLTLLADHWHQSNQPGRSYVCRTLRQALGLSVNVIDGDTIKNVENEYQTQLTSMDHIYFSTEKVNQSLHNTFAKITSLYKSKNKTGLEQLINSIYPLIKDNNHAHWLFYLAQCYLNILQNNNAAALTSLMNIEEENQTEVDLKQQLLLSLELHKIDLAEEILIKIIVYSDEYIPQYAHILSIQGKNQLALNAYLDYLDKYPDDIKVLLKLGAFLAESGQVDGAISVFKQVLAIDPHNLTAPNYLGQLNV